MHVRTHITRAGAALALVAALAGCDRAFVNAGAALHASEWVAKGKPAEEVYCQVAPQAWEFTLGDGHVIEDHLWLIPSEAVSAFGCEDAYKRAIATRCDETGCHVLAVWHGQLDGNPYRPLTQAPVDPPGRLP